MKRIEFTGYLACCNSEPDPPWPMAGHCWWVHVQDENKDSDEDCAQGMSVVGLEFEDVDGLRIGARYRVVIEEIE